MKKFFLFLTLLTLSVGQMWGANKTYTKITSTSSLSTGDKCLIVCESQTNNSGDIRVFKASVASSGAGTESEYISMSNSSITCNENYAFTLTSANGTDWKITGTNGSIGHISGSNTLGVNTTVTNTISFSDGNAVIGCDSRVLRCNANNGTPLFRYYSNTQQAVQLYKEVASSTPTLSVSDNATSLALGDAKVDGLGVTNNTLSFSGNNLTANVSLAISGPNADMFSVSPTSVNKGSGTITNESFTVTYAPTASGNHTATLTISSTGATAKEITLSGTGKYEVIWKCAESDDVTTLVASGSRPTFPSTPTSCDSGEGASTNFYGWSTGTWSGKVANLDDSKLSGITIYTSAASMPTVSANGTTYHAVFCKGGGGSVTLTGSDFHDQLGSSYAESTITKTIGASNYTFNLNACEPNNTGNKCQMRDNTTISYIQIPSLPAVITRITATSISNASDAAYTGTLHFKSAKSRGNANTNDIARVTYDSGITSLDWDLSSDNTTYTSGYFVTSAGLRITDFTVYYGAAGTNYMTTCCTELGSINGSVSCTQTGATLTWDKKDNAEWEVSYKVKGAQGDPSTANVGDIDEKQDDNTKLQCSITELEPGTDYEFYVYAVAEGYCEEEKTWKIEGSTDAAYEIIAQSNNESYGTVLLNGTTITGDPAQYCTYATTAYTVSPANSATVSQNGNAFNVTPAANCTITINFAPIAVTSVELNSNAETLEYNGTVTLTPTVSPDGANPDVTWESSDPTVATVSNGTVTATQKAGTTIITCKSSAYPAQLANCTITVVPVAYYKKVTAELADWSGEYLLVYENSASEAYVWTGVEATSNYASTTITDNKITKPATGVKLVLDALTGDDDGKYSIKIVGGDNNGKYLDEFNTSNANIKFTENAVPAEVSYDGENNSTQFTTGNKYMRYNNSSGQYRFRGYASNGQSAVQLYRKVVTSVVTITAPAEGTGSLALANGQTPVASGDNIEAGTELTVTATPSAQNHYIGGTVTVTKTVGGDDVTEQVYNSTTGKITMPEYAITVSVTFTPTYAIVSASVTGGSFSWEETTGHTTPAYAAAGTQIQASANATDGFVFGGTFDIYQTGATSTKVSHTNGLFTMPAYAVTIGGTFNVAPTITLSQTSTMAFTKVATGASTSAKFTVSAANLTAGSLSVVKSGTNTDKFNLSVSSITVTAGSVSNAEVTVTPVTTATGDFTATITVDDGENGAAAQSFNVTLHVEDQYTINWYVNGSAAGNIVKSQTAFANEDLDIPTASDLTPFTDCSQFVFLGWKDGSAIDGGSSTSAPSLANVGTKVAASKNYYAVFGDGSPAVDESDSWDLESESDDWTGNNTETYFSKPYGIKKANAYIVNSSISDFENYANGADEISITVTCFQNSGSTSRLTVYLVDEDGAIIAGTGKEFTPANGSQVSDATDAEVTYNASELSDKDATGYMVKCTTYGKNILITGTAYEITKAENYEKYYTTCPQIKNVVLSAATVDNGSISFKVGGKAATNARTENGAVEVDIVETHDTGYELTGIALSALSGASYNSTTKKIELAKNTNGSLTVTPTFSQKNYSISVESYPASIGATLTGTTSTAKYGVEQTISTNEPTGYIFGGWYMYDGEDTGKETDLSEELFTGTYAGGDLELEASFLMPDKNIVAEAYFDEIHDVAWALENTPSSGSSAKVYVKGLISKIDSYQSNTITYWISDNGQHVNGTVLEVFKGKGEDNANFTAIGNLTVGDEVIVYGQLTTYGGTKEFGTGNYLYSRTAASLSSVVVSAPDASLVKTEYFGTTETFSYAGLKATAEYNTGYQKDVTDDATWKANGSASLTVTTGGTVNVTATYGGETSSNYGVAVTVTTKTLESITVSPAALTGYKGQALPKPTTVTANFDDQGVASSSNVTAQAVYDEAGDYSASSTSAQTIAVKYTFGPTTKSANYTVTLSSVANTDGTAYSVAKAQEIIDIDRVEGNDLDLELAANKVYVTGVVTSISGSGPYTIQIKDNAADEAFLELYKCTFNGVTSVEVGDVIKAYGNLYWYAGGSKYEINEGGQVVWKQPKVSITIANKTLEVGDVWTIAATIDPAAAPVTYSIKDGSDDCITLATNVITATAEGTATIIASAEAYDDGVNTYAANSKEFTVTVQPAAVHTNVVILAEYNGTYYALKNDASTVTVEMNSGMVMVANEATKNAIIWDRAERNGVATFKNGDKYLKGGSSTTLSASEGASGSYQWTWTVSETKSYYTANPGESQVRSFLYQSGQGIKNYAVSNIGNSSYAQANVVAKKVAIKIAPTGDDPVTKDEDDVPSNASIVVSNKVTLEINNAKTLDNLTVEAGGTVSGSAALSVNDLTIKTTSGSTENQGKSGQLTGSVMPVVSGDLFIEIKLCEGAMDAAASRKWYCISAPFNVNMNGGFFWGDGTPMVLNTDFQLFEWDGDRRATGISGWKRVSGVMKAGIAYFIGFDDANSNNQNIIKLKATNKTISNKSVINAPGHSSSVDEKYANWNGLANPNFRHIALNKDVQAFDYNVQSYTTYAYGDYNFVVGTPFFIKETGNITIGDATHGAFRAPKREVEQLSYCVRIVREGKAGFDNQMYVRASEEASASYEEGHDLVTMNAETSNYGALLWTVNYGGKRLAIEEAPLVNDKASYALSLYAPADGAYRIETPTVREDASLYLTYEGNIIWDLSAGAYELDLNKGATEGYGLMMVRKAPQVTTGVENVQGDKTQCTKVILNDHVYILRDGQLYDVTGKAVK